MRRYLILILLVALLVPCLAVPASASSQGVIDAIDDLAAGLGTSQGDIVDLLTSIDEWIYEGVVQLQDISSTLFYNIWEGYCIPMYDYFFTANVTMKKSVLSITDGVAKVVSMNVTVTGFRAVLLELENNWLSRTTMFYNQIQALLKGDTTASDVVQDQVNQDSTEASDYLDIMDDVTKPDESELEDISDISDYVDTGDVGVLADAYAPIFQNATFLAMTMLSLTFALIAFTLYGKR